MIFMPLEKKKKNCLASVSHSNLWFLNFFFNYYHSNPSKYPTHTQHSKSTKLEPIQPTIWQIHNPPFKIHTHPQQNPPKPMFGESQINTSQANLQSTQQPITTQCKTHYKTWWSIVPIETHKNELQIVVHLITTQPPKSHCEPQLAVRWIYTVLARERESRWLVGKSS